MSSIEELTVGDLKVTARAVGPDGATMERVANAVKEHPEVRRQLPPGTRWRLLAVDLADDSRGVGTRPIPYLPEHYQATIYDYTNNWALLVTGRLDDLEHVR